jgi:D-alanyl-D-alanine endopeptidase (penicillin-binding protein 7)
MRNFVLSLVAFLSLSASANTYALYNFSNAELVIASGKDEIVPIASITKLFTAITVMQEGLDLTEKVKVQGKNSGRFPTGTMVTRMELMKAMLIASDNRAADSLAYSHPGGYDAFISRANEHIGFLGLKNTKIEDASGLSPGNTSTASDLTNFVWSLRNNKVITSIASSVNESVEFDNLRKKSVKLNIRNTNPDITKYNILISKTGYTNKAGRCLLLLVEHQNEYYGLAVLGEKNPRARAATVKNLINSN